MKLRNFLFTCYDTTEPVFKDSVKCAVWQKEMCPETKREHLQMYVEFKHPVTMVNAQNAIGKPRCHAEQRRGSRDDAIAYCSKTETRLEGPWTFGDIKSKQGQRTDLIKTASNIKEMGLSRAIDEEPHMYIKFHRGMEKLAEHYRGKSPAWRDLHVKAIWGAAGSGKTRQVYAQNPDLYKLPHPGKGQLWWDGYEGQDVLLIDDFRGWISYSMLLHILDGYPLQLPIKGGFTHAKWTRVYITSNKSPSEWYSKGLTPELSRRLSDIVATEATEVAG